MIVTPSFFDHWKTRLLIQTTRDESAPLCLQRLWGYCQEARRHEFHEMTPAQLDSICHWGRRKPSCHVALIKSGFLEKLTPKGFAVHQWDEYNASLLQKWEAGKKGGRPAKNENANEIKENEKPDANRTLTGAKPIDQTRPDQIDRSERTDPTGSNSAIGRSSKSDDSPAPPATDRTDSLSKNGLDGLVGRMVGGSFRVTPFDKPSLDRVKNVLKCSCWNGAEKYASAFLKAMDKQDWKDRTGQNIHDWKAAVKAYACSAERNKRGVGRP
jgi:hypothetical protein